MIVAVIIIAIILAFLTGNTSQNANQNDTPGVCPYALVLAVKLQTDALIVKELVKPINWNYRMALYDR